MNYELAKEEFIKLKKEELDYIDNIAKISITKTLSEYEKLEIYRNLKDYKFRLNESIKKLRTEYVKAHQVSPKDYGEVIIEFDIDKNFLSSINFSHPYYKEKILRKLGLNSETYKFELILHDLLYRYGYSGIDSDMIQNNQKLFEKPIYVFIGYWDSSYDCYGPAFGYPEGYIYGQYEDILDGYISGTVKEIPEKQMSQFEKDKIIIHSKKYVRFYDVKEIFEEELLNTENNSIEDCIIKTEKRIKRLSYVRSPEYKEKVLLNKINKLYKKVKGEFIKQEILYSGSFLDIIKETYKLPNEKVVEKEKIIKNGGKNSVIIIAINQEKEYIITFQNRIKDKLIAEFPAGYIEDNEEPIEAAKRELKEETGYISDDLFIIEEAFTNPGIDNSTTYIVVANNCIKANKEKNNGTEFVKYGLFKENELEYFIINNIMNGAMNKLAYYSLNSNTDSCNYTTKSNNNKKKVIYKKKKKIENPLR